MTSFTESSLKNWKEKANNFIRHGQNILIVNLEKSKSKGPTKVERCSNSLVEQWEIMEHWHSMFIRLSTI